MTNASPPRSQPNSASYAHVCPEVDCIYYGKRTDPRGCGCHRTREQMMLARIEELEARTSLVTFNEACKRIEELEAALREVIQADQIQTFRTIEVDPAGNTMAVLIVDGTCATIARSALPQSSTPARSEVKP